jgi:hypothetical protein
MQMRELRFLDDLVSGRSHWLTDLVENGHATNPERRPAIMKLLQTTRLSCYAVIVTKFASKAQVSGHQQHSHNHAHSRSEAVPYC